MLADSSLGDNSDLTELFSGVINNGSIESQLTEEDQKFLSIIHQG